MTRCESVAVSLAPATRQLFCFGLLTFPNVSHRWFKLSRRALVEHRHYTQNESRLQAAENSHGQQEYHSEMNSYMCLIYGRWVLNCVERRLPDYIYSAYNQKCTTFPSRVPSKEEECWGMGTGKVCVNFNCACSNTAGDFSDIHQRSLRYTNLKSTE